MKGIDKIKSMTIEDWQTQILNDEHLIPTLCFMCNGNCDQHCVHSITEFLESDFTDEN